MSNPRFYIGQLDQATFTMTEAESVAFPLSNLKNYFASYQWVSSTTAANQSVILDWGSAKECDFAIFENHNFASLGVDAVKLQAADDAGFTTGLVTLSSSLVSIGSPGKVEFTAHTKRYWRVYFEKASGALTVRPELGQMFVNKKLEMTQGYNLGYRAGNREFLTYTKRSLAGIELAHQNHDGRTIFEFKFALQGDAFKTNWVSLCNAARGRMNPFYYVDPNHATWYVVLQEDYNPVRTVKSGVHETDTVRLRTTGTFAQEPGRGYGHRFGKSFRKGP